MALRTVTIVTTIPAGLSLAAPRPERCDACGRPPVREWSKRIGEEVTTTWLCAYHSSRLVDNWRSDRRRIEAGASGSWTFYQRIPGWYRRAMARARRRALPRHPEPAAVP